jgi:hypothetical protein
VKGLGGVSIRGQEGFRQVVRAIQRHPEVRVGGSIGPSSGTRFQIPKLNLESALLIITVSCPGSFRSPG